MTDQFILRAQQSEQPTPGPHDGPSGPRFGPPPEMSEEHLQKAEPKGLSADLAIALYNQKSGCAVKAILDKAPVPEREGILMVGGGTYTHSWTWDHNLKLPHITLKEGEHSTVLDTKSPEFVKEVKVNEIKRETAVDSNQEIVIYKEIIDPKTNEVISSYCK